MPISVFEKLLYTTVRICCNDASMRPFSCGTGFFIQKEYGNGASQIFLVSNKHVFSDAVSVTINIHQHKNKVVDYRNSIPINITNLENVIIKHPIPEVDIAVLDCTYLFANPLNLYIQTISYDMLADFSEPQLNVAQSIYFVGYPDNRYDTVNNLPLIRTGIIASSPKIDFDGQPKFLIDAQVFPGSSGSPVLTNLTYEDMKNGNILINPQPIVKLLGVVAQTMIRQSRIQSVQTSKEYAAEEIIGLGIVFKSSLIKEILDTIELPQDLIPRHNK